MTRQPDFQTLLQTADYIRLGAFDSLRTLPRWLWIGKLWEALSAFNDHAIERELPPLILIAELKHRPQIARSFRQMSENGEPLRCRLNFLNPDYATVNIYLAPNTENGAGRLKRLFSKFRHDLKPREKND